MAKKSPSKAQKASQMPNLSSLSLEQLQVLQFAAQSQIVVKQSEEARKEGRAFKTLDDLNKTKKSNFKPDGKIPSEYGKERKTYRNSKFEEAYDCPSCGIVLGKPSEAPYDNIGPLSGSRGYKYRCTQCHTELGKLVLVRS